jgi:SAM-dependent methyltransferase
MSTRLPKGQYVDSRNLLARANLHTQYSTNHHGWGSWLFQQLELQDNQTILDVGCGPGGLWRDHVDRLPNGCRAVLTDSSPGMISEAKGSLPDDRFEFRVADAQELPYPDGHFDCVTANHMLYHVPDLDRALSEIARVLTSRGKLCAATNGDGHMRQLHDIIRRSIPSFTCLSSAFTLESGKVMLDRHFGEVSIRRYQDSLVVPDADALSAYVRSMGSLADASAQQLDEIEGAIREQIRREGPMRIEKAAGLFIATQPGKPEPMVPSDADKPRG